MKFFNLLLITIIIGTVFACKKKQKPTTHTDIYFAGTTWGSYLPGLHQLKSVATYWKNGVAVLLSTDSLRETRANGILINGKDIYVVGNTDVWVSPSTAEAIATYWKNGVRTELGRGIIYGIAAKGNDIYMVGAVFDIYNKSILAVWKNGKLDTLGNGRIESIAIDGDDIYMAGCKEVSETGEVNYKWNVATYWKNGKAIKLDNTEFLTTNANNMFVYDGDKYFVGSRSESPSVSMYWKNKDSVILTSKQGKLYGDATDIYVDENSIYISGGKEITGPDGYPSFRALYWKNNVAHFLPHIGTRSFARCITVQNGICYIGGDDQYPVYWKNGKRIQLGTIEGAVSGVAVVNY